MSSIHGRLYFVLAIFDGINLSTASDLHCLIGIFTFCSQNGLSKFGGKRKIPLNTPKIGNGFILQIKLNKVDGIRTIWLPYFSQNISVARLHLFLLDLEQLQSILAKLNRPTSVQYNAKTFSVRREHSGSVVECLTGDREAAGSSLFSVMSKTH